MAAQEFDYVICGGGSAGCVLANRLSANGRYTVALLEAGGGDAWIWFHIPVGYLFAIGNPRADWMFRTEAEPGLNGRSLAYPRGKVIGGCSAINAMISMRGQAADYDHWRQLGLPAWGWDDALASFKALEDHFLGASDIHAVGGGWRIEAPRISWDVLDAVGEAAAQMGIRKVPDFNTGNNEGVGYFEVNQRRGVRWNASKAFLRAVAGRPNLEVRTGWQVTRLLLGEGVAAPLHAHGIEARPTAGGAPQALHCRRELILCAGAIGTPQLLQLSGIGPHKVLQDAGIEPRLDHPGVGENLQDHLQIRAVFGVDGVKTLNTMANSALGKAWIGLEYLLRRSGPMSMAPSQLGAFTRSSDRHRWPNVEYHVQPLSLDAFGEPLHRFNAFTASVCNLNPTARGHVRIRSPRPEDAPRIMANYLSTPADRRVAADSLQLTRRIVGMPALARYRPREIKPGVQFQSEEELARLAGDIGTTIFHPVGTCRMGRADDPLAVVDSRLRVLGISGLRVADASVMPTITSGNTNSPTLMIAERAAEWVLAQG